VRLKVVPCDRKLLTRIIELYYIYLKGAHIFLSKSTPNNEQRKKQN